MISKVYLLCETLDYQEKKMEIKYLTRKEAASYLIGLPTSHKTLAKLATIGGGPKYQRFGNRRVVYTIDNLTQWASSKLSAIISNTSEEI